VGGGRCEVGDVRSGGGKVTRTGDWSSVEGGRCEAGEFNSSGGSTGDKEGGRWLSGDDNAGGWTTLTLDPRGLWGGVRIGGG